MKNTFTVQDVLTAKRGGPGFDLMRLLLSVSIVVFHSYIVTHGDDRSLYFSRLGPLYLSFVPMFFAVSGFLVTGSAINRGSLGIFFLNRIRRIYPALIASVLIVTLIVGPLLTTFAIHDYFRSRSLYSFFTVLLGWPRYEIPGLFMSNPNHGVNITLWTLTPEFICYAFIGPLIYFSGNWRRQTVLIAFFGTALLAQGLSSFYGLGNAVHYGTPAVMFAFMTAATAYVWSDKIPVDWRLFCVALVVYWLSAGHQHLLTLAIVSVVYVTIYLGMLSNPNLRRHDFSYGTYVYGYPIQQTIEHLCRFSAWWAVAIIALPLTLTAAAVSWYFIERPATQKKVFVDRALRL